MRKAQPRCINFILTGYPADLKLATTEQSRGAHYFTKPVEIDEMVKTMRKELAAQNSSLDRGQEYDLRSE